MLVVPGLVVGIFGLVWGASLLVRGASTLARLVGVTPLFIGITIVALGTSMPELVVNVIGALRGATELGFGNVVGSNVFNILVVLGVAAIIRDVPIGRSTTRIEIPLCVLSAYVLLVIANDHLIDGTVGAVVQRSEGLLLLGFFAVFVSYTASIARREPASVAVPGISDDDRQATAPWPRAVGTAVVGLVALLIGGHLVVDSATTLAEFFGVPDRVIAITVVAVGTSLPELVTSIVAAVKNELDIAVGNAIGSSLLNTFMVFGVTASIQPIHVPAGGNLDLVAYLVASTLLFLFVFTGRGRRVDRLEGVILVATYGVYIALLFVLL